MTNPYEKKDFVSGAEETSTKSVDVEHVEPLTPFEKSGVVGLGADDNSGVAIGANDDAEPVVPGRYNDDDNDSDDEPPRL